MLAQASTDATALPALLAALVSLVLPWLLVAFTAMSVHRILLLQVIVFFALAAVLCLPRVRNRARAARCAVAYRAAIEQFFIRGIARKKDRSGVLIFVSLAEHYARVIADEGIAARVPPSQWQEAVDTLVARIRNGRVVDGFIAAIELCGNTLSTNFPHTDTSRDELPDRIYLI